MKKIAILSWWTWSEVEIAQKSAFFIKKYIKKDYDYYELPKQLDTFLENKDKYSLTIPVFHWEYWEDGRIFAFLDILGISHVFSDYSVHSLCLDKYKTNIIVESLAVNIPKSYLYKNKIEINTYPQIIKPNKWWSSFYTYKINNESELKEKINILKENIQDDILIQEFIPGDEYSIPVINWTILPIMKLEKKQGDFFDYTSKYEDNTKIKETFPEIEKYLEKKLIEKTEKIYDFFGLKWISRIDFLVKNNEIYFLEVNTIPWLTDVSILPQAWKLTGKSFEELIEEIIK